MTNFEYSQGSVTVRFDELPQLQPQIIQTQGVNWWQRFKNARTPRKHQLIHDWEITVSGISTILDGTIVIPAGSEIDGASIPFPWLVAFLTFGVLRPMGILFVASIPHDYAFVYGKLNFKDPISNNLETRSIQRHEADWLFFHIVKVANKAPVVSVISWLAVRLGWYWIKYNGKYRGGNFPVVISTLVVLKLAIVCYLFTI